MSTNGWIKGFGDWLLGRSALLLVWIITRGRDDDVCRRLLAVCYIPTSM